MERPRTRTLELRPNSILGWIVLAALVGLGVALAVLFFTAFLALLVVSVVAAPILRWWRGRKLARGSTRPRPEPGPGAGPKVIDVEYEVRPVEED